MPKPAEAKRDDVITSPPPPPKKKTLINFNTEHFDAL